MKIGFRIERSIARAPAVLLDKFRGIPTGNLADAGDRLCAMHYSIKPISQKFTLVGSALTIRAWPGDNLIVNKAIAMSGPGDVLVIDNGQFEGGSVWGDLTSFMAKNAGAAGMVTNGLVRDIAGIVEADLPVFARGSVPNGGFKRGPGEIGYPVVCGGVTVKSGDIIAADIDGVVVIPLELAEKVLNGVPAILENERKTMEKIRAGMTTPDNLDKILKDSGYELA
ncbi:MAG: RraA family protein [Planctomycetota bacterium]|jgi:regulator of RNase E activity RraA|nr:RraA family protein [Planctomycetota bacterium]